MTKKHRKVKDTPTDQSRNVAKEPSAKLLAFFGSLEEKLTGRAPESPAQTPQELQERWDKFATAERISWLSRPRIHTGVFGQVHEDERIARLGGHISDASKRAREIKDLAKGLGWSKKRLHAFKDLVIKFREEADIESYLEIKHQYPEVEIQVGRFGGIEALFALENDLQNQGIASDLVVSSLDADEPSIDALSVRLIELLVYRNKLPISGPSYIERRRSAISDATVNFLISTMLEAFDWHEETFRIPSSLVVLIRYQLCGNSPDLLQAYLSKEKRQKAAFVAAQRLRPDEKVSVRKLAMLAEVPRSTAARWLADEEFQKYFDWARKYVASDDFKRAVKGFRKAK